MIQTQHSQTKLPRLVFFLFLLQPLMDCLSFWTAQLNGSSLPTLALRFSVLGATVLAGFWLSSKKRHYILALSLFLLLYLGHLWAVFQAGAQDLFSDLTNYIRVLQLPLTTMSLISCIQADSRCYDAMKRGMAGCLAITLAATLLAALTGTEPHTYSDGTGSIGWFSNTNSQSSILCVTVPVAVLWLYQTKTTASPLFWMGLTGGFAAMYGLGTRLAFFGLAATGLGLGASLLLLQPAGRKKATAVFGCSLLFLLAAPWSPMARHQAQYQAVQADRQTRINSALTEYDLPVLDEPGLTQAELARRQALWIEALTPVYTLYAPDFVALFGADETIRLYDFTTEIGAITEQRPKKLRYARALMEDSPASARLFGLELNRFTVGENNYDVENDFHGIYYLYGFAGLVLLLGFLLWFLQRIPRALLRDFRRYYTPDSAAWGIGLICCLLHGFFTAGVLRRPNASFFLAATLAAVYHLTKNVEHT